MTLTEIRKAKLAEAASKIEKSNILDSVLLRQMDVERYNEIKNIITTTTGIPNVWDEQAFPTHSSILGIMRQIAFSGKYQEELCNKLGLPIAVIAEYREAFGSFPYYSPKTIEIRKGEPMNGEALQKVVKVVGYYFGVVINDQMGDIEFSQERINKLFAERLQRATTSFNAIALSGVETADLDLLKGG